MSLGSVYLTGYLTSSGAEEKEMKEVVRRGGRQAV